MQIDPEADITINGQKLSENQSSAIRMAVGWMLNGLKDPKIKAGMGKIAGTYSKALGEVEIMIVTKSTR